MSEREAGHLPGVAARPWLLDLVREAIRRRHYSYRTEEAYLHWIRRFIFFSGRRHPRELGAPEVTAFLNDLVARRHVAAATQNQALAALLFLYKEVLAQPLPWLEALEHAKQTARRPTVLTVCTKRSSCLRVSVARNGSWRACSTAPGCGCVNA
jgi:hypothetical protein